MQLLLVTAAAAADTTKPVASPKLLPAQVVAFTFENDVSYIFDDRVTDEHYTNGVQLTFTQLALVKLPFGLSDRLAGWTAGLPALSWPYVPCTQSDLPQPTQPCGARTWGIGQTMHTPADLERSDTIFDDRPYVGWTYLTGSMHVLDRAHSMSLDLQVGTMGPASGAQHLQSMAHWWWAPGSVLPQGWNNQVRIPLTVDAGIRYSHTLSTPEIGGGWRAELSPRARGQFGTVMRATRAGMRARAGWNVPAEIGLGRIGTTGLIRPKDWSFVVTAEYEGRAVWKNVLVDGGGAWRDHLHVARGGYDLLIGGQLRFRSVTISHQWVDRSREFRPIHSDRQLPATHRFGITSVGFSRGF